VLKPLSDGAMHRSDPAYCRVSNDGWGRSSQAELRQTLRKNSQALLQFSFSQRLALA